MSSHVNHIIMCGYDPSSRMLIDILRSEIRGEDTQIVIFANDARPAEIPSDVFWVEGDPTKESELEKVNVERASAVVVAGSRSVAPQVSDAVVLLTLFTIQMIPLLGEGSAD